MVQVVAPERLPFVNAFRGHVLELATHPFGCRVLQRCLENMPVEHTRPLLDEMLEHSVALMQDQFGVRLLLCRSSPVNVLIAWIELRRSIRSRTRPTTRQ